jgi:hypothetical protein
MATPISFDELQAGYGIDPDEFNVELSTATVLDADDVAQIARSQRMAWDRTGSTFDKSVLDVPAGTAMVEFEWGYGDWAEAREAGHYQTLDMAAEYPQLVAVEPVFAEGVMRYYFARPSA